MQARPVLPACPTGLLPDQRLFVLPALHMLLDKSRSHVVERRRSRRSEVLGV